MWLLLWEQPRARVAENRLRRREAFLRTIRIDYWDAEANSRCGKEVSEDCPYLGLTGGSQIRTSFLRGLKDTHSRDIRLSKSCCEKVVHCYYIQPSNKNVPFFSLCFSFREPLAPKVFRKTLRELGCSFSLIYVQSECCKTESQPWYHVV